ncbi:hemicentin-1-like [Polypterus senegalus]|uniref:hemicentin-1-like n=1 Tax=Polypterus senegalus TaxID=55291 RepID=UPI001965434A|nr:hemicentin-1-like [Polypterus senegalus]
MTMEVRAGVVLAALCLSLFSYCCSAACLISPQNILNGAVGGEITFNLSIDPVDQTTKTGTWTFGTKPVVTWTESNMIYTKDYIGRVEVSRATGTLKFNKLFATDSGEYTVTITTAPSMLNLNGRVELKVYEPVSNVKITAKPGQPIENKTFSLTCDASGQVDSIHWVKNDQPLSPSGHIILSADSKTLSFNHVLRSDDGDYKCTSSTPASKMSSEVYTLIVSWYSSLSLTTPTCPIFGWVGSDVTLNFSLNPSNAVLQAVTWTVNNTNNVVTCVSGAISYGQGYEGRAHLNTMTGSLSLFRLTLRDSGQYSVNIITTEGEAVSGSVTLQVLGR